MTELPEIQNLHQFMTYLRATNAVSWAEPRVEKDGAYEYHCFDDKGGNEIGFITYYKGSVDYYIRAEYLHSDRKPEGKSETVAFSPKP